MYSIEYEHMNVHEQVHMYVYTLDALFLFQSVSHFISSTCPQVVKKLQGAAAGSATWVTNIGNERGEVLMSVVTQSEGAPGLQKMAEGLMMRYESAGQTPPCLLYTDRDYCSQHSETLFSVSMDLFRCEWTSHLIAFCHCRHFSVSGLLFRCGWIYGIL